MPLFSVLFIGSVWLEVVLFVGVGVCDVRVCCDAFGVSVVGGVAVVLWYVCCWFVLI